MGYLVLAFLILLAIVLMVYEAYHPWRLRKSMNTTSIDMRCADDGRGDGIPPEDPSMTWMWPNS